MDSQATESLKKPPYTMYSQATESIEKPASMDEKKTGVSAFSVHFKSWLSDAACDTLPQIPRNDHWVKRVIWLMITLGLTGWMAREIYFVFDQYFQFPVTTAINYTNSRNLAFPAITLCNLNPVKKSELQNTGGQFDSLFGIQGGVFNPVNPGRKKRNVYANTPPPVQSDRGNERFAFVRSFARGWAKLKNPTRIQVGHKANEMIVSCSFAGERCGPHQFITYSSGRFGNCFTFNSGWSDKEEIINTTKTGHVYGLSLEVFLDEDEYLPDLTEQVAARLHIHDQHVMPFPEDSGFNLPAGFLTTIGLKQVKITRKPFPYPSNCSDISMNDNNAYSIYSKMFGAKYSRQACLKTCYQREVIRACKCFDSDVPYEVDFFKDVVQDNATNVTPCITFFDDKCIENETARFRKNEISCDCPIECEEVDFRSTISLSTWPSKYYLPSLRDSLKNQRRDDILNSTLERNLLKLEMYYDTLNFEHIYEEEKYTQSSLISDLGGQMGLWCGASFILVFQSIELFIDVSLMCCGALLNREKNYMGSCKEASKSKIVA